MAPSRGSGELARNLLSHPQPINGRGDNAASVTATLARGVEPAHGHGLHVVAAGNPHRRAGAALDADELAVVADEAAHLPVERLERLLQRLREARREELVEV